MDDFCELCLLTENLSERFVADRFLLNIVGSGALYNQKEGRPTARQIERSGGKQK